MWEMRESIKGMNRQIPASWTSVCPDTSLLDGREGAQTRYKPTTVNGRAVVRSRG